MKKSLIILVCFLSIQQSFSQSYFPEISKIPRKLLDSTQNNLWDVNLNKYTRSQSYHYTYNIKGKVSTFKDAYLNRTTNRWLNRFKIDYFFKTGTDIVQYSIRTLWDTINKTYVNDLRNDNTILNDNVTSTTSSLWNKTTSGWEQASRTTFSFLANGLTNVITSQRYDISTNQWINVSRISYNYNSDKNLEKSLFELWDNAINDWGLQSQELTSYNGTKIIEVLAQGWNKTNKVFTNINKKEHFYNASNQLSEVITYFWSNTKGSFEINSKMVNSYDSDNDLKENTNFLYNSSTSSYNNNLQNIYFYSNHEVTNTNNQNQKEFTTVYPTLANDKIYISVLNIQDVKIYSAVGKCVFNGSPDLNNAINVSMLCKGTYYLNLLDYKGDHFVTSFIKM